jgi:hypothetical protein
LDTLHFSLPQPEGKLFMPGQSYPDDLTANSSNVRPIRPDINQQPPPDRTSTSDLMPAERPSVASNYRWFRFENDAINDPRVLRVTPSNAWIWVCLLCIASKYDGELPPVKDIAVMIRMEPEVVKGAIKDLLKVGLLKRYQAVIRPADWDRLQRKSDADPTNAERQKRYRDRKREGTSNALRDRYGNDTEHHTTPQDRTEQDRTGQDTTPEAKAANDFSANGGGRKEDAANGMGGWQEEIKEAERKAAELKSRAAMNGAATPNPQGSAAPPSPKPPPGCAPPGYYSQGWHPPEPTRQEREAALAAIPQDRFFAELRGAAVKLGFDTGWAAHRFKDKYGKSPPRIWNDQPAAEPSEATVHWINERQAAYDKEREDVPF